MIVQNPDKIKGDAGCITFYFQSFVEIRQRVISITIQDYFHQPIKKRDLNNPFRYF